MHVPFPLSLCPVFLLKVSPSLSPFLSTALFMPLLFALSYLLLGLMCLAPGYWRKSINILPVLATLLYQVCKRRFSQAPWGFA